MRSEYLAMLAQRDSYYLMFFASVAVWMVVIHRIQNEQIRKTIYSALGIVYLATLALVYIGISHID